LIASQSSIHDGVLPRVLRAPFAVAAFVGLYFLGLLVVAWSVNGIWVAHIWSDGVVELRKLLDHELEVGRALAVQQGVPQSWPTIPANALYGLVFEVTGIHEMGARFAQGASLSIPDTIARRTYLARHEMLEVAMLATQLLGVRGAILVQHAPLLLVLYVAGMAEGLSQRAIRRTRGGRESASVYHRAKYLQVVVLGLGIALMLVWPSPLAWGRCAGIGIAAVAMLAALQWTYYKKHV